MFHTDTEDALSRSHGVLKSIFTALCGLLASCEGLEGRSDLTVEQYTSALYQVMSEEDGCLVHLLQASTSILRQSIGGSRSVHTICSNYTTGLQTCIVAALCVHRVS